MQVQQIVDNVLAVSKESVKTFTFEWLNNIVRLINGFSALMLAILPGKASVLEGIHGWELRPTFRAPKLPRWMENGVSSFNQFIHDYSVDSDTSSDMDYSSEEEDSDQDIPASPLSNSSRVSRANRLKKNRHWINYMRCIFSWLLLPLKFLVGLPSLIFSPSPRTSTPESSTPGSARHALPFSRRLQTTDNVIQHATDRRRGVVEDLHLGVEIFIESIFDVVHKAARYLLAPLDTLRGVLRWFFSRCSGSGRYHVESSVVSVTTATLSETSLALTEKKIAVCHSLNTDSRTCQDVITELGYPYEAIRVVTADGYVLILERIPRRESRKVVYLQHGVLDSSMGWVANGVVGSPAFAAYDQGYDVFLGNFRGLVSREHVNEKISSREYWRYSINEHGTQDIPAMLEKIHEIKVSELESTTPDQLEDIITQPYKLCAICHSLGGASILMYVITRRIEEKPHRLSRLILLSPAGFHADTTFFFTLIEFVFLALAPLLALVFPAFYIPTRFFRMLLNKLARDFHKLPAVGGLVQTLMSYVVGGDSSNWVGVLGLPHYNMNDMPGVSFRVALHLAQMKHAKKFLMFDYGSAAANMEVYGIPEPIDLGEHYNLIDIPVDLVAGRKDMVIQPSMIRKHYKLMKNADVDASYNESDYAHLDFTFSHNEELLDYVMSRLLLVEPPSKQVPHVQKPLKLKKQDGPREK